MNPSPNPLKPDSTSAQMQKAQDELMKKIAQIQNQLLPGGPISYLPLNPPKPVQTPTADLPCVAGPVVAYRAWKPVRKEGGEYALMAVGINDMPWPAARPFRAACHASLLYPATLYGLMGAVPDTSGVHTAPSATCKCGIWAVKDPAHLHAFPEAIIGTVALWGRLIEQQKGYRAEFAYPLAFLRQPRPAPMPGFPVAARSEHILERLSWAYGVPVVDTLSTPHPRDATRAPDRSPHVG